MKIIFMGTPEFAAVSLQRLIDEKYEIAAVFTQPDKPVGRHQTLTPPAVKQVAQKYGIEVYQPKTLKDGEAQRIIEQLCPDIIVVVAYGKILPPGILYAPKLGCVNVHASLLPKYRGAGPIQWSIINGEKTTGVTTMFMAEGLDTGDMILKSETAIGPDETAGELHDRLAAIGADTLVKTLRLF
ncbi:MAG TPA: methionyl-tRNA formyltransferase, partial [Ruminococcaceae bacterium]|nr:methionyl-tRNA formyltransferase [Oscillospiraceae bacterium]